MRFMVLNRKNVQFVNPSVKHIIISITEANDQHPTIKPNENCLGVLKMKFGDVDDSAPNYTIPMEYKHAEEIVDFVQQFANEIELIICQCDGGISRSAAVASALSVWLNGTDAEIYDNPRYLPNSWVRNRILKVLLDKNLIGGN